MKVTKLNLDEQAANLGATHVVEITKADLTDGDDAQTLALFAVSAKMAVMLLFSRLSAAFVSSDADLISTTITVGDGGSATRFLASQELNEAGTEVFVKSGAAQTLYQYTGDDTVDAFLAATTGKLLSSHTAGKLLLYFAIVDARTP